MRRLALVLLAAVIAAACARVVQAFWFYRNVVRCEALFARADGLMDAGRVPEAMPFIDECLRLNPYFFPAYDVKADYLIERDHDVQAALDLLQRGLALSGDCRFHLKMGEIHLNTTHEFALACDELRIAHAAMPDGAICAYELSLAESRRVR